MKILFVATKKNQHPEHRELYEMNFLIDVLGFERSLFDLGIVTVAACTPREVNGEKVIIEYIDEYLDEVPYDTDADLVALSAKTSCAPAAYAVADKFREHGKTVVLGGIHASLRPEEALEHVDHVVIGEAEKTWPMFVKRFQEGNAPRKMDDQGFVPMSEIPVPRWDELPHERYMFHQVQTTRGCPFMCRFCSVPDISGNQFRFKPIEKLVHELTAIPGAGYIKDATKSLYVVDDNFLSRVRYTKDLLKAMVPLHRDGKIPLWSAETTLNVALDEELMDLLAEAGCNTLIIGFESISEQTLLAMNKKVNFCASFKDAVDRIHRRGIGVMGNFIVGFDTDTLSVFQDLLDFVNDHNILYPFFSILTPMPGTKLHDDYRDEGRLDHTDWSRYDTRHVVMRPENMTREQLMDGYCYLFAESYMSEQALERLERIWRSYPSHVSTFAEKAYTFWKMRKAYSAKTSPVGGTDEWRSFLRAGTKLANTPGVPANIGHLLYYFDSAHFSDFLKRYRSPDYERNVRIFKGLEEPDPLDQRATDEKLVQLNKKQWDSERYKKRERKAS